MVLIMGTTLRVEAVPRGYSTVSHSITVAAGENACITQFSPSSALWLTTYLDIDHISLMRTWCITQHRNIALSIGRSARRFLDPPLATGTSVSLTVYFL
jgi:hypothetical protein